MGRSKLTDKVKRAFEDEVVGKCVLTGHRIVYARAVRKSDRYWVAEVDWNRSPDDVMGPVPVETLRHKTATIDSVLSQHHELAGNAGGSSSSADVRHQTDGSGTPTARTAGSAVVDGVLTRPLERHQQKDLETALAELAAVLKTCALDGANSSSSLSSDVSGVWTPTYAEYYRKMYCVQLKQGGQGPPMLWVKRRVSFKSCYDASSDQVISLGYGCGSTLI